MEIHSIQGCRFYGDNAAVISSTAEDTRFPGIGINCQMKASDAFLIKKTGSNAWRRMKPDEASIAQRAIATTLWTAAGIGTGYLIFGPVGAWVGGLCFLKIGLKYGGVGRQAPIFIMAKDQLYVGALPLWQVKKLTALIESPSANIEFEEAAEVR